MSGDAPCRGCGKTVHWVKDQAGKSIPLDPVAVVYVQMDRDDPDSAFKITKRAMVIHYATCSAANGFSKQKEGVTAITMKLEEGKLPVIMIGGKASTVADLLGAMKKHGAL